MQLMKIFMQPVILHSMIVWSIKLTSVLEYLFYVFDGFWGETRVRMFLRVHCSLYIMELNISIVADFITRSDPIWSYVILYHQPQPDMIWAPIKVR